MCMSFRASWTCVSATMQYFSDVYLNVEGTLLEASCGNSFEQLLWCQLLVSLQ